MEDIKTDFKTVTLTFNRDNKDIKDLLVKFMKETGKSKVDILADALRQYDPNKEANTNFDRSQLKEIMRELLKEEGLIKEDFEEEKEENTLNELNKKILNKKLLDDDE